MIHAEPRRIHPSVPTTALTLLILLLSASTILSPTLKAFGYNCASIDNVGSGNVNVPPHNVDWNERHPELDFHLTGIPLSHSNTTSRELATQEMALRVFNSQTNETMKYVTFVMNISRIEEGGTESVILSPSPFQYVLGPQTFIIKPSVADNNNETTISSAYRDPFLHAWTSDPGTPIVINDSELLKSGKYHAHLEIFSVDFPKCLLPAEESLWFDVYWTVDNSHIDPSVKNQVIASTVVVPTKIPEFPLPATMLGISVIGTTLFTILLKRRSRSLF